MLDNPQDYGCQHVIGPKVIKKNRDLKSFSTKYLDDEKSCRRGKEIIAITTTIALWQDQAQQRLSDSVEVYSLSN